MFAGIVESIGTVVSISATAQRADSAPASIRLRIEIGTDKLEALPLGASIAINGVCLTLVEVRGGVAAFDAVPETMRLTNLGDLAVGGRVNIERSLRVGDRIDGHFVQGHVDEVGVLERIDRTAGDCKLWIRHSARVAPFIVRKGSITLDGVSLTVVDAQPDRLSVVIIPTTWKNTTLGLRNAGERINIETDILARLVVSRLDAFVRGGAADGAGTVAGGGVTWDTLRSAGFAV